MKENQSLKQLRLNYINKKKANKKKQKKKKKRKQQTKKEHIRLVKSSIMVDVVAKTDDEIYFLTTAKYMVTFRLFSTVPKKGRFVENIEVMLLLKTLNTSHTLS